MKDSLKRLGDDYGLTPEGVRHAIEAYQDIICEITGGKLSKLTYDADYVLEVAEEHYRWKYRVEARWNYLYRMNIKNGARYKVENEKKQGSWQWKIHGKPESGGTLGEAICDQCGESTFATAVKGNLNFCPNCGAEMENGDK